MSGNVIERMVPGQVGGARVIALWDVCLWNMHYVEKINTNAVKYAENANVMFYPEAMFKKNTHVPNVPWSSLDPPREST